MKRSFNAIIITAILLGFSGFNLFAAGEDRSLRIAIIGSGVSGLTAGHFLKKQGYHNISVFEKEDRIGGKVHSQELEGVLYEIGAVWVFKDYKTILALANEYKIPLQKYPSKKTVLGAHGQRRSFFDYAKNKYGLYELTKAYWRAKKLIARYPELARPGFSGVSSDLFETFANFVKRHKVEAIASMMEPFLVGCGYGYTAEIPALYYMKPTFMLFNTLVKGFLYEHVGRQSDAFQFFPGGYQELWEQVAADLDLHLRTKVIRIVRKEGLRGAPVHSRGGSLQDAGVELITDHGSFFFDKVIISSPLDATLQFLDASEEEAFLFSRAKNYHYHTLVFRGSGLPRNEVMFLEKATAKAYHGTPAVIGNPSPQNDIWLSLHLTTRQEEAMVYEDLKAKLTEEVKSLGGRVDEILLAKEFSYFFHYTTHDLQALSPYEKLEGLQGKLNTYYVGGFFSFESVEHCAEYSQAIVEKYFANQYL